MLPAAGNSGRKGRRVIVGCLQQHRITMEFRPGNKSSGMAARTPWYAAATAAAGEVMEGADRFIISYFVSRSLMVRQHRGAGGGTGLIKLVNFFL